MKKLLTLALLATFAIGGATAQVYLPGGTDPIECEEGFFTCAWFYGTTVGYTNAYPNQGPINQVNLIDYSLTF